MMSPRISGLLFTCLLISCLAQGQEDAPAPPAGRGACPQGFGYHGSHCYGLLLTAETWDSAELQCQDLGSGHLVSLLTEAEASFVATMVSSSGGSRTPVWIGLRDTNKNGRWRWSSNALFIYKSWDKNAPSSSSSARFCATLTPASGFLKWTNTLCTEKYPYVCKFKA